MNPPIEIVLARIRSHAYPDGRGPMLRQTPRGYDCRCPAHADRSPSLGILHGDTGCVILKCQAGCTVEQVASSLGLSMNELFPPKNTPPNGHAKPQPAPIKPRTRHATLDKATGAAAFGIAKRMEIPLASLTLHPARHPSGQRLYHNAQGKVVAAVVRHDLPLEPNQTKPAKQFTPLHVDGDAWVLGDPTGDWPLYHLPEVMAAIKAGKPIWWCEGEDTADALMALGLVATTTAHGAKSPQKTNFKPLAGAEDIYIVPDNDPAGLAYAQDIARRCLAAATLARVKIVPLPNLPPKGDAVEYVASWGDAPTEAITAELESLAAKAPLFTLAEKKTTNGSVVAELAPISTSKPKGPVPPTDLGNGERFAQQHAGQVLHAGGDWYAWDGRRWKRDETNTVEHLAKRTARSIYDEAAATADTQQREVLAKWAVQSESAQKINAMLQCCRSEPAIARAMADFDKNPWLFNCQNGTLDLKTAKLTPHNPADLITKLSPVDFDPHAQCPTFLAFLDRIFAGKTDVIEYVQKLLGMAVSGDCGDQLLPIFWGEGANGKSTLLELCQYVSGDYASSAPDSLLTVKNQQGHPCELADLQGRRLVVASETEATDKLRIQLIKKLTGETVVKARRMYGDWFEFPRTHHLVLQTNHKPRVAEETEAVWRRLRLVPFTVIIPEAERVRGYSEILKQESSGVLSWLVLGCLEWQKNGLTTPADVEAATKEFREESNPVRDFLDELCVLGSGLTVGKGNLRQAYLRFCTERGSKPIGDRTFSTLISTAGGKDERTKYERFWSGIGLINQPEPPSTYQGELEETMT